MRRRVIEQLADELSEIEKDHPVRVGIDGITAAGKTVLADELVEPLRRRGRSVLRVSADGFHHPPEIRHRKGKDCPVGYYEDSFDYAAIKKHVLQPLGPEGSRQYRPSIFDFRSEDSTGAAYLRADADAILLFEGVMLFRKELHGFWDYRIFVHIDFETGLERALERDVKHFGSEAAVRRKHTRRFFPGQQRYLKEAQPHLQADALLDNKDPSRPVLTLQDGHGR